MKIRHLEMGIISRRMQDGTQNMEQTGTLGMLERWEKTKDASHNTWFSLHTKKMNDQISKYWTISQIKYNIKRIDEA